MKTIKLNYKKMKSMFSENDFTKYGFKKYKTTNNKFYWFKDNNAKILAVAHLDSVQKPTHFHIAKVGHNKEHSLIFSPVLDDRLGVYVITDFLNTNFGLKYDILLTTDEEIGQSTARYFKTNKKYLWGFEFDRSGDDVVNYDYEDNHFNNLLTKSGFKMGWGSFTDISDLEHLGCKFFNVGVGYYNYHSKLAYAVVEELTSNIQKFLDFYNKHKHTHLPHTKKIVNNYYSNKYNNYWDDYYQKKFDLGGYFDNNQDTPTSEDFYYNDHTLFNSSVGEKEFNLDTIYYTCASCKCDVNMCRDYILLHEEKAMADKLCLQCYDYHCNGDKNGI